MTRLVRVAAGASFAAALLVGMLAPPANAGPQNGIGWQYSESADGYYREPHTGGGGGGGGGGPARVITHWGEYNEQLRCPEDDQAFRCAHEEYSGEFDGISGIVGMLCGRDATGPRGLPEFPWIRYTRDPDADEPESLWYGAEAGCDEPGEDDFISMEEISYQLDYEVFQPLGLPEIDLRPDGRTLVNLPVVVSTDYPEGIGAPAVVLSIDPTQVSIPIYIDRPGGGLSGQILADASYDWNFGEAGAANGRGRPYLPGRLPSRNPGYYTTGTFSTTGEKTVTLTATWTGTVTVDLLDPEEIVPLERVSTDTVTVVESRSALVE